MNPVRSEDDGMTQKEKAFTKLHDEYSQRLVYYANNIVNNKMIAEDIVANFFVKLLVQSFKPEELRWGFLSTSIRNACIDHIRYGNRTAIVMDELERTYPGSEPSYEQQLTQTELMEMIDRFIKELPAKYRKVLEKTFSEEKDAKTAATELRIPLSTIYRRDKIGRALLLNRLRNEWHPLFAYLTALLSEHCLN
jgi:RNA polymerase sigma factor (sigma-70 family)